MCVRFLNFIHFLSNSRTKHWNIHFEMWFKQRKHIINFLLFLILCKSVGLSSCRTIDRSWQTFTKLLVCPLLVQYIAWYRISVLPMYMDYIKSLMNSHELFSLSTFSLPSKRYSISLGAGPRSCSWCSPRRQRVIRDRGQRRGGLYRAPCQC